MLLTHFLIPKAGIFKHNRELFNRKAAEMTANHARPSESRREEVSSSAHDATPKSASGAKEKFLEEKPLAIVAHEKAVATPPPKPAKSKRTAASDEDSLSDGGSSSENDVSDFESDDGAHAQHAKRQRRN